MTEPLDLEEGKRLLEKATAEPWSKAWEEVEPDEDDALIIVAERGWPSSYTQIATMYQGEQGDRHAALIVWLRNNADALLEAAAERDRLREHLEQVVAGLHGGTPDIEIYRIACAALSPAAPEEDRADG